MITIKKFRELFNFPITAGSTYDYQCYGSSACMLDSRNGEQHSLISRKLKEMFFCNLLTILLLLVSSVSFAQTTGIEKSWEKGIAYIPDHFFNKSPPDVLLNKKYPVLILMHGCTGITQEERSWANIISKLGFIVILPDSFARPNRVSNCSTTTFSGTGNFPYADYYRQQEISYALEKLQTVTWSDKNNIFLMGHSEGGRASAFASHQEVKGKIISGWTCMGRIYGDRNMPMLAVAHLNDPWRGGALNQDRCIDRAKDIVSFTQIDLEGPGHATSLDRRAREAVKEFLTKNLN